mgnify:CR=1 FL=1
MILSKKDYKQYIKLDLEANNIKDWKWIHRFSRQVIYFQRMLRKLEYIQNCRHDFMSRIYLKFLMYKFRKMSIALGFTIPLNVFGAGLSIAHYGSIVVNKNTRVGENCRIHSGTNIGTSDGESATIGNNVYIGPGAKIVGGVTIGDNVAIGANAVVISDVPSNVTVGGIPAKIISQKGSSGLILKKVSQ